MLYLSPIFAMLHLFGHKTLIQLKCFIYYRKKSLRIMFFQSRDSHTGPLFKVSKILKSFDKTALENCIFISKSLKGLLPSIFNNWFKFSFGSHCHDTTDYVLVMSRTYFRVNPHAIVARMSRNSLLEASTKSKV